MLQPALIVDSGDDDRRSFVLNASDFVMPDVARIGGATGWMQAAGIAAA
jgi:L-alanine-DL-glutamate epimerase-like enolase superfamily enzyme